MPRPDVDAIRMLVECSRGSTDYGIDNDDVLALCDYVEELEKDLGEHRLVISAIDVLAKDANLPQSDDGVWAD